MEASNRLLSRRRLRRRREEDHADNYTTTIPSDLIIEILSRLPTKSLIRFQSVSKLWFSSIRTKNFIDLFLARSRTRPRLLLPFKHSESRKRFILSAPECNNKEDDKSPSTLILRHDMTISDPVCCTISRPVNGLVCCVADSSITVCNPATRQIVKLPDLTCIGRDMYARLGYDPVEDQYKVLCVMMTKFNDIYLWKRENGDFKEVFSTAQTWNIIRMQHPKVSWFKGVWFSGGTPRFSFQVWVAMHNRLATGDRVIRWNPQAINTCWLCKTTAESRDHLFFECVYSREVWLGLIRNLAGNRRNYEWSAVVQELVRGLSEKLLTFLYRYCFQATVYAIWRERNVRRVGEPDQTAPCLITRLDRLIRNRISSLRRQKGSKYEKAMAIWFGRSG